MEEPSISLVVPVGGGGTGFDSCLCSLSRLDPLPCEMIVVLDGPNEAHARLVADSDVEVNLVTLPESRGPAVARNVGAEAARGTILFFVDSDVEVGVDSVSKVKAVFERDPELAALIGSYDDAPGDPAFLSQYRNLLHHFVHQNAQLSASTFWGACGAVRKEAFEAVGGFDEGFLWPSVEDIELGSRLRQQGHQIAMVKDLQVKHLKCWTIRNMLTTDLLRRAVPWTELMLRDGGLINDLNVSTKNRWSVFLVFVLLGAVFAGVVSFGFVAFISFFVLLFSVLLALLAGILLVVLNVDLYRFFVARRGILFGLRAMFWHWAYLVTSGSGFMIGWFRHKTRRFRSSPH